MNSPSFATYITFSSMCLLVSMLGCGESKESLHEMDHVVPAHWPSDLSDAASKIRERLTKVQETASDSSEDSAQALKELSDLVGWVPEVAADTDLAEPDWMKLYVASETARKKLLVSNRVNSELVQDIEKLSSLLTECQALIPPPLVLVDVSSDEQTTELEPKE
jgi:hypothetical protein